MTISQVFRGAEHNGEGLKPLSFKVFKRRHLNFPKYIISSHKSLLLSYSTELVVELYQTLPLKYAEALDVCLYQVWNCYVY